MTRPSKFAAYVDGWLAGTHPVPPIVELLGIRLLGYGENVGTAALTADRRHHNAMGTVHGGVLCDLADVAIGAAVTSVLQGDEGFTTISLTVDFFRGVKEGHLVATARVVKRGSAVAFCSCVVEDESGDLIARVSSTCLIRRPTADRAALCLRDQA